MRVWEKSLGEQDENVGERSQAWDPHLIALLIDAE